MSRAGFATWIAGGGLGRRDRLMLVLQASVKASCTALVIAPPICGPPPAT